MNKFLEMAQEILLQVAEDLKGEMIAAKVFTMDKEITSPIMTVIYNDMGTDEEEVMADYTVIAGSKNDESVAYLESFLTFTDELSGDNLTALYEAISKLNFYLPYGAFTVDTNDSVLGYKFGMPISTKITADKFREEFSMLMTAGYIQADRYIYPLMQIAEGKMSVDELVETLN